MQNPFTRCASPTGVVDHFIGDAYPVVRDVQRALPQITYLAANLDKLVPKDVRFRYLDSSNMIQWAYVGVDVWFDLAPIPGLDSAEVQAIIDQLNSGQAEVQAVLRSFKNQYMGPLATPPISHPDGTPLQAGDIYFDSGTRALRVYAAGTWGSLVENESIDDRKIALAAQIKASKLAYFGLGERGIDVPVSTTLNRLGISPKNYGGKGDNTADDLQAIRDACLVARTTGSPLDLRNCGGAGWKIVINPGDKLDLSGISTIICEFASPILVHRTAHDDGNFAVTIGVQSNDGWSGRQVGTTLLGNMQVVSGTGRTFRGNGVYMKGAWLNINYAMGDNFNGMGMYQDTVWDSFFARLRTERCGNATTFAHSISSSNDTSNCFFIGSLQCESAYQKGIYCKLLRGVIMNIHAERTIITVLDDELQPGSQTLAYTNHYFELANTTMHQAVFHAAPIGQVADDGVTVAVADMICVVGYYAAAVVDGWTVSGDFTVVGGVGSTFNSLICRNLYTGAPSYNHTFVGLQASNVSLYDTCILINPSISAEFNPTYFAQGIDIFGGYIYSWNATNTIRGNIRAHGTQIINLNNTQAPLASHTPTAFTDCDIEFCNGGYGARALIRGGRCEQVNLSSQTEFDFQNVKGTSYNYSGNSGSTTDEDCEWTTVVNWALPLNRAMRKGARSTNPVYTSGQPWIFVNKNGAFEWATLQIAP